MIVRLFAHRDARRYLIGQVLSLFGDSSMWLVCGIWVQKLTGSDGAAGLTFFFFTAPAVFAPLAGYFVDRLRRRRLLVVANLAGALIVTPLFLVDDAGDSYLIYAVMLLYGTLNIVIAPAQSALVAGMLPEDLRVGANSVLRSAQESLRVLAPLAGTGLFVAFGGSAVVVLDIVSFCAAAGLLLSIKYDDPRPTAETVAAGGRAAWRRVIGEMSAGFRFIIGSAVLRRATGALALTAVVLGSGEAVTFAVAREGLHRPAEFLGVMQAAQGIGAAAAGLGVAYLIRRTSESTAVGIGMTVFAVGTGLIAVPSVSSVLAGKAITGLGLTVALIALLSLLQRVSPPHLQGRVFAGVEVSVTVPQTVAIALGAALVGLVPFRVVLIGQALLMLIGAAALLRRNRDRPAVAPVVAPLDSSR